MSIFASRLYLCCVLVSVCALLSEQRCIHDDAAHQEFRERVLRDAPPPIHIGFPLEQSFRHPRFGQLQVQAPQVDLVTAASPTTPPTAPTGAPPVPSSRSPSSTSATTTTSTFIDNIRIVADTSHLFNSSLYCASVGEVRPDFKGNTYTCSSSDILNSTSRDVLLKKILPAAVSKLQRAIKVWRSTTNIQVPASACSSTSKDHGFYIPPSHRTVGIPSADIVLYIVAARTEEDVLAWAIGCVQDTSGRNVVGVLNIAPRYIDWDREGGPVAEMQVATTTHEIIHALGFSQATFQNAAMIGTSTARGKTVKVVRSPNALTNVRNQFVCATLDGAELEDEGGAGSATSHWERRLLREDIMTAAGGTQLSAITLGVLEDLGYYTPDYTQAEPLSWAKYAGCDFATKKCDDPANAKYFCFDSDKKAACTYDHKALGYCNVVRHKTPLPSAQRYFADPYLGGELFLDGCPVVERYSNRHCAQPLGAQVPTANEMIQGFYFGPDGRCFESDVVRNGYAINTTQVQHRCLEAKCDAAKGVSVAVGGVWATCPSSRVEASLKDAWSGYYGTTLCPEATVFCRDAFDTYIGPPTTNIPTTDIPTLPPAGNGTIIRVSSAPTTGAPPAPGVNVRGVVTFSGKYWSDALSSQRPLLEMALRLDMASLLAVPASEVILQRLNVGSLEVGFGLTSGADTTNSQKVEDAFKASIRDNDMTWMGRIRATYKSSSTATDDTALVSADISQRSEWSPEAITYGLVIGILLAAGMVLGCISFVVFLGKNKDKPLGDDFVQPRPSSSTVDVPRPGAAARASSPRAAQYEYGRRGEETADRKPTYEMGAKTI